MCDQCLHISIEARRDGYYMTDLVTVHQWPEVGDTVEAAAAMRGYSQRRGFRIIVRDIWPPRPDLYCAVPRADTTPKQGKSVLG